MASAKFFPGGGELQSTQEYPSMYFALFYNISIVK